ncbi:hypothetical protein D5086_025670 [Populus alba]|uniref:Uncharacterized protein n=1 Tax=Populus alba TaxID=43335 RepID=A0ACC4AZS9_POPAL
MSQPKQNIAKRSYSWFRKFQYNPNRDTPSDARNVLLVVVALIAAVTFQAGVNPPGGVWQDNGNGTLVAENGTLVAGNASMMITYASAVFAVTPRKSVRYRYLLIIAFGPFVMRCLGYFFKKYCMIEIEHQIGSQEEGDKRDGQAAGVDPPGGPGKKDIIKEEQFMHLIAMFSWYQNTLALSTSSVPFVTRCLGYFFKKYCVSENESTQIGRKEDGAKRDKKDGQAGQQV